MTRKKATKKAKPFPRKMASNPEMYTTLHAIERESPCQEEYVLFLNDIRSLPSDIEDFDEGYTLASQETVKKLKRRKTSQFGPDSRIPLSLILKTKSSSDSYDGFDRIRWIVESGCALSSDHRLEKMVANFSLYEEDSPDRMLMILILTDPVAVVQAMEKAESL